MPRKTKKQKILAQIHRKIIKDAERQHVVKGQQIEEFQRKRLVSSTYTSPQFTLSDVSVDTKQVKENFSIAQPTILDGHTHILHDLRRVALLSLLAFACEVGVYLALTR